MSRPPESHKCGQQLETENNQSGKQLEEQDFIRPLHTNNFSQSKKSEDWKLSGPNHRIATVTLSCGI